MSLEAQLTPEEQAILASLTTPRKIQDFLDSVVYEAEYFNRSPLRVLRERRGHCLDGALIRCSRAAAAGLSSPGIGSGSRAAHGRRSCARGLP